MKIKSYKKVLKILKNMIFNMNILNVKKIKDIFKIYNYIYLMLICKMYY